MNTHSLTDAEVREQLLRRTNRLEEVRVYSLTTDQSVGGIAGIFSRDGPIGRRKRRYILTTDQSRRSPPGESVWSPPPLPRAPPPDAKTHIERHRSKYNKPNK
eukprot:696337-Prorocentrum_minimum.AAC.1